MKSNIAAHWSAAHNSRTTSLNEARENARLTKPWVLPAEGHNKDSKLPQNYQSDGAMGMSNIEGRILVAMFPPQPWFTTALAPEIQTNPEVDPTMKQDMADRLFWRDVLLLSLLQSANLSDENNRRAYGFNSRVRTAISHLLITGDTLVQVVDDFRLKVHRRDRYVTERDESFDVISHTVKESIDAMTLTEKQLKTAKLKPEVLKKKSARDRRIDQFTHIEWQPWSKVWVQTIEVNGWTVAESDERITPMVSVPFEEVTGEHYGRAFIDALRGDLLSLDVLSMKVLDFADAASKFLWATDYTSAIKDTDLAKPSGSRIRAKVVGGQVQDFAAVQLNRLADFSIVESAIARVSDRLSKNMLTTANLSQSGDAMRSSVSWQQVAAEVEGILGGFYGPIAERLQGGIIARVAFLAEKQRLTPPLTLKATRLELLTGVSSLSKMSKGRETLSFAAAVAQLGETAMSKIDTGVLVDVLARSSNIDEPGLVKSRAMLEQERAEYEAQAARGAAVNKAIDVAGNVAQAAATQNNSLAQ